MVGGEARGAQHRGDAGERITWFFGANASIDGAITVIRSRSRPSQA